MALNPAQVAHGPFLIGVIFNIVLYGIMMTQTYLYYTTYKSDRLWMKLFVAFLFIADTLNSVFDLVYIYDSLVNHFGDAEFLTNATWVFGTDPAMTGIIGGSVQLFFAWRVHVVSRNIFAVSAVVLSAVTGMLASLGTSIGVGIVPQFVQFQKFQVVVIIWLASATIADVIISMSLVWHLSHHKTGFAATDDVINRIIRLTVQTGMITAIWAVVDLVCYLTITTGIHLIFNVPLAKLYTNSLMSSLNSRGGWKFNRTSESSVSNIKSAHRGTDVVQLQSTTRPEVFVHVESHEMIDVDSKPDLFSQHGSQGKVWPDQKSSKGDDVV
ncbi:hypothetical protein HYDPIDRAFT_28558 [Hydnomerulius pinastri MD-312]|uniref:DUF6534 domain-containing protein n=1 Tax=Hydnomerulius pinastri MD-312 TaxID=994086 RepID=A0A0C9W9W6_9AGAM|nr:hypothetical protein HYDPIDRAFT_28558 [Hydnomerulius pinastri MD-312]